VSTALDEFLGGPGETVRFGREPGGFTMAWGEVDRVGIELRDRIDLRAWAGSGDPLTARAVAVHLVEAEGALTLVPPAHWQVTAVRSRPADGGWLTVVRLAEPLPVDEVVGELARQSVTPPSRPAVTSLLDDDGNWTRRHDERVLNPIGFGPATGPVVDLRSLDTEGGPTERMVRSLRDALGVRVAVGEPGDVETVAGLAMAGVPLIGELPPQAFPPALVAAVAAPVDLGDPLAREEHSLVVRRAALDAFGTYADRLPAVSIVLATRRPEMLEHALAQVARQRGVAELELVLAPHGFDPGPVALAGVPLTVLPQPADTPFGDVLQAAALAASGEVVLKMDDDDWYAPDVVADLLRARAYSGAQLVGMPAEFHYLTEQDVTVRRGHSSEHHASFVAGGTMMVDRALLLEVGGFRSVRKYVDAQLLAAVAAAGAATYRTHGLGYVLRRNPSGHTWQADLDYLLDPSRVAEVRPGFAPSRLLDLPRGA
jgi:hypothetical protein